MAKPEHTSSHSVVTGAVVDAAALIRARFDARAINVSRATRALAHLAGAKRSARRGRGVEFDEVRLYAAGDDVRAIDWRVTARSGEAHTKLFHEERERPVIVAVDLEGSMQFGSRNCFKAVLASHVASLLLWSALDSGERVGGLVFNGSAGDDVRPQRSRRTVLRMIGLLEAKAAQPDRSIGLLEQLKQLQRTARPGSSVFIVSDFQTAYEDDAFEQLRLLARHTQITAIAVSDPLEIELPLQGRYVVSDGVTRSSLETGNPRLRQRYQQQAEQHWQRLRTDFRSLRIPLIELSTQDAPLPTLQRYFPAR